MGIGKISHCILKYNVIYAKWTIAYEKNETHQNAENE
jgi:hypothetical protein